MIFKTIDRSMLLFYYITIISFSILIFLGTLYLSTLMFEDISDNLISVGEWVIITCFLIMAFVPLLIIGENIFLLIKKMISKNSGRSDIIVHCKKEGNTYEFYVDWSKNSKWVKRNIKEINICLNSDFDVNTKNIKLTSYNKWYQKNNRTRT